MNEEQSKVGSCCQGNYICKTFPAISILTALMGVASWGEKHCVSKLDPLGV